MSEHKVLYKGLRSTNEEVIAFIQGMSPEDRLFLMGKNQVDGFQRALIVVENSEGGIQEGYSVVGYFINHDGKPGNILVERESKSWTERGIKERLRRGNVLETSIDINEDGRAQLINEAYPEYCRFIRPHRGQRTLSLEEFLIEREETFPMLKAQYRRAQHKFSGLLAELDRYSK